MSEPCLTCICETVIGHFLESSNPCLKFHMNSFSSLLLSIFILFLIMCVLVWSCGAGVIGGCKLGPELRSATSVLGHRAISTVLSFYLSVR